MAARMVLARLLAVELALAEAAEHVVEQGTNTGQRIREYQAEDGYKPNPDTGYPWCASFVGAMFAWVGRPLDELKRSASVGFLVQYARPLGWVIGPGGGWARGDVFCVKYRDGNTWHDHTGLVVKRHPDGSATTVEGNTGDAVLVRQRDADYMSRCDFIRVPGQVADPRPPKPPKRPKLVRWAIRDEPDVVQALRAHRAQLNANKRKAKT